MNILFVLSGTKMGGATHSVLTLISGLHQKGVNIIVSSPDIDPIFNKRMNIMGITLVKLPICFKIYPPVFSLRDGLTWPYDMAKLLLKNYIAKSRIAKLIVDNNIDIVHTNVGPILCGYEACVITNIPHVWHIREYGDKDFHMHVFPNRESFLKKLKNSFSISITQDLLQYNQLVNFPNALCVYNSVRKKNDVFFESHKSNYFLCASRISPEKGFDQILRVFSTFHSEHENMRLKILGMGDEKYVWYLRRLCESLGISGFVDFEGYKENVTDYMKKAKALLVASPSEGFGRMTAEAAFAGCVVIGKNTAGTKEILNITGGYHFNSDEEMLSCMQDVCNLSSEEYKKLAIEAQQRAIANFSEENYVESIFEFYENILSAFVR